MGLRGSAGVRVGGVPAVAVGSVPLASGLSGCSGLRGARMLGLGGGSNMAQRFAKRYRTLLFWSINNSQTEFTDGL